MCFKLKKFSQITNDSDTDSDNDSNTESETEEAYVPQTHPGSKEPMPVSENVTAKTIKQIRKYQALHSWL